MNKKAVYLLIGSGVVLLLCLLAALGTAVSSPATVTVRSTTVVSDGDTTSITNLIASPGPDGVISLREAIQAANNTPGYDTIEFNIPVTDTGYMVSGITGTWTISLTASLPTLTDGSTVISGTTQAVNVPAYTNPDGPEIEIAGAGMGSGNCLNISSANNVVDSLVINRCPLNGILISSSSATTNTVSGNYIGTDASGALDLGNFYGVRIENDAQNNVIGGDTPGERNIISGNTWFGVEMGSGTNGNTVSGNYIGTDASGALGLGNYHGVYINGTQNNVIGGDTPGERNVISGNDLNGVHISGLGATTNTVSGNYIGTDALGLSDLGNARYGVYISGEAQNNVIGGDTPGERNIISGNDWDGVRISGLGVTTNTVSGNYIGTDTTGTQDLGNSYYGVRIENGAQNNIIGPDNVISGNDYEGVVISDSGTDGNTVFGNYIGTDATGTQDLGNTQCGVIISGGAQNNVIGGDTPAEGNVIAGNDEDGVLISSSGSNGNTISGNYIGTNALGLPGLGNTWRGVRMYDGVKNNVIGGDNPGERNVIAFNGLDGIEISDATSTGNTITKNSIHSNAALGIELRTGANGGILAPAISVATCTSASGTAPISATVELFTGPDDEGKIYLTTVSADGSGNWGASGFFAYGFYLTATATDLNGNTSEFSLALDSGCRHTYLPLTMKNY